MGEELDIERTVELVKLALTWLDLWSKKTDDEGSRVWSDEDSYEVESNGECVTVMIVRCDRSLGRTWYVPHTEAEAFEDELRALVREMFR